MIIIIQGRWMQLDMFLKHWWKLLNDVNKSGGSSSGIFLDSSHKDLKAMTEKYIV